MPLARAPLPVLIRPPGLARPPRLVALLVRAPLPVLVRPLGLARPPRLVVLPVRALLLVRAPLPVRAPLVLVLRPVPGRGRPRPGLRALWCRCRS